MGGSNMKLIVGMEMGPNGGVHRYSMAEMGGSDMGFIAGMGMHPKVGVHRYGTAETGGSNMGFVVGMGMHPSAEFIGMSQVWHRAGVPGRSWGCRLTGLHVIGIEGWGAARLGAHGGHSIGIVWAEEDLNVARIEVLGHGIGGVWAEEAPAAGQAGRSHSRGCLLAWGWSS